MNAAPPPAARAPGSLAARLAWRLAAVLLAALLISTIGLVVLVQRGLDRLDDRSLQTQARDIHRHLRRDAGGALALDLPVSLAEAYRDSRGDFAYVVYDAGGLVRFAAPDGAVDLLEPAVRGASEPGLLGLAGPGGRPHYGYVATADDVAPGLRIAVAQSDRHRDVLLDSIMDEYYELSVWWLVPVLAVALGVGVLTIRGALAPIERISRIAGTIEPGRADVRLPAEGLPAEVLPLVSAVNRALDRLEAGFAQQRRFTADAAHELRTPLAVLTARVAGVSDEAMRRRLLADLDRMSRIVAQLLTMARLDSEPARLDRLVDLRQVCVEAASAVAVLATREGHALSLDGAAGEVPVRGDGPLLAGALVNLLQNALRASPPGGAVEMHLDEAGRISVADRGPGIPATEREAIFQRFRRGAGAAPGGAGLGLAIVRHTVEAHGGQVEVADRPGGGAVFTVDLRAARIAGPAPPGA